MTPREITNAIRDCMAERTAYTAEAVADALGLPIAQVGPALSYLARQGETRRFLWDGTRIVWAKVTPDLPSGPLDLEAYAGGGLIDVDE